MTTVPLASTADADWDLVGSGADVTTRPRRVQAAGRFWTAYRPAEGTPAAVVADRCPHRLVQLDAGTVVDAKLQCPYHGWQFATDGSCTQVPSAGPGTVVPPRAHLETPDEVAEHDGQIWVLIKRHPPALTREIGAAPVEVLLLGDTYTVQRNGSDWSVQPPIAGARSRYGLVWLAPDAAPRCAVAGEKAVLDEDLALQGAMTGDGLPLLLRVELHVRADRSGVALRRALRGFIGADDPSADVRP